MRKYLKSILLGLIVVTVVGLFFVVLSFVTQEEDNKPTPLFFEAAGDGSLAPTGRRTSLAAVNPPTATGSFDWTIVGSIFNPQNGNETLAWWEPTQTGDIADWELKEPSKSSAKFNQRFLDLTTGVDMQVAVGSEEKGISEQGAAWYRRDNGEWKVASSKSIDGAKRLIEVDISIAGKIIAVGVQFENNKDVYGLWYSDNGKRYSKVDLELEDGIVLIDVAASEQGFVAVGNRVKTGGLTEGLAWVSTNGKEWKSAPKELFAYDGNFNFTGVATNESGFVITGGIQNGIIYFPTAWISQNLEDWIGEGIFFDEGESSRRRVSSGYQAAGVAAVAQQTSSDIASYVSFTDRPSLQQVWISRNGRSWAEIGQIKDYRDTGVPVLDVGIMISGSNISAVAITSDIGIWSYSSSSSWREIDFMGRANQKLPRIEDGPVVSDVTWDFQRQRFIAVGAFLSSLDDESQIVTGGRFWESNNLGKSWSLLNQFYLDEVGGPVGKISSSELGVAAVGNQDAIILDRATSFEEKNSELYNPNPQGLFWNTDEEGRLQQFLPNGPECRLSICVTGFTQTLRKNVFFDIVPTSQGYILGGVAFVQSASATLEGIVYVANTQTSPPSYHIIDPSDIGLKTDKNDYVTTLCTGANLNHTVLFGAIEEEAGFIVSSAVTTDGGINWTLAEDRDNSFAIYDSQFMTSCTAVPTEICNQPDTMFKNLIPCTDRNQNPEYFFVAVGASSTQGESDARAWWSSDGILWESLSLPEEFSASGDQEIVDVIANEKGIIFVGNAEVDGIARGHLWMENQGVLEARESDFGQEGIPTEFVAAALSPDSHLVVVGSQENILPRIWYSQLPVFG